MRAGIGGRRRPGGSGASRRRHPIRFGSHAPTPDRAVVELGIPPARGAAELSRRPVTATRIVASCHRVGRARRMRGPTRVTIDGEVTQKVTSGAVLWVPRVHRVLPRLASGVARASAGPPSTTSQRGDGAEPQPGRRDEGLRRRARGQSLTAHVRRRNHHPRSAMGSRGGPKVVATGAIPSPVASDTSIEDHGKHGRARTGERQRNASRVGMLTWMRCTTRMLRSGELQSTGRPTVALADCALRSPAGRGRGVPFLHLQGQI